MLEKSFDLNIKENFFCVNVLKMVRRYSDATCTRLSCMEDLLLISREEKKYKQNIFKLFEDWKNPRKRKHIISYNRQDVESLKIVTDELIETFHPNLEDFRLYKKS